MVTFATIWHYTFSNLVSRGRHNSQSEAVLENFLSKWFFNTIPWSEPIAFQWDVITGLDKSLPMSPVAPFINLVNFNPSMDTYLHPLQSVRWNYLFIPKLQRYHRWSLGMNNWFHPTCYCGHDHLSMLALKLNHVSKMGPCQVINKTNTASFTVKSSPNNLLITKQKLTSISRTTII